MNIKPILLSILVLICGFIQANGQSCPTNIDFETGTGTWTYYRGTVSSGHVYSLTATPAVSGLHSHTSGSGTDAYGLFPVVAPGGGLHSLKLGHDSSDNSAERATYYVHVPTTGDFSLIYRFAAVLQDGAHAPSEQPRFLVNASDSATGSPVSCINYDFKASSSTPSFLTSSTTSTAPVRYKQWTMGNMKFYGLGGQTIRIDFTVSGCTHGDHWGYAYLDMNCNLFTNTILGCGGTTTLTGPDGYATYYWIDSATFSMVVGASQVVVISTPTVTTTYALILTPHTGYGCPDTLYTRVSLDDISGPDTVCVGATAALSSPATGGTWSSSSSSVAAVGTSSGIVSGISAGTAIISYTAGSCTKTKTVTVTLCPTLGVPQKDIADVLKVFPNPNNGEFTLFLSSSIDGPAVVTVANIIGEKIEEFSINTNQTSRIKFSQPPGIYLLSTNTLQGKHTAKMVITD